MITIHTFYINQNPCYKGNNRGLGLFYDGGIILVVSWSDDRSLTISCDQSLNYSTLIPPSGFALFRLLFYPY
jgi:hypothetical protein